MERRTAKLLAECLDWLDKEGGSVEEAVRRYPEVAEELKMLIETSGLINRSGLKAPRPEFRSVSRTRLENRIKGLPEGGSIYEPVTFTPRRRLKQQKQIILNGRRLSMSWLMVIVMAVSVLMGGGGVAFAASDALPGDALYPVRVTLQDVGLALSGDAGDIDLLLGYLQGDVEALEQLAEQARWADLEAGLQQYQGNLDALVKTRSRMAYLDAPSEEALNSRIQLELQTQVEALMQLQLRLRDQQKLQEKIQEAIQQSEQGNVYGPAEGGPPEEGGEPNGAGPGEPQGNQNQQGGQDQNGQPDDAGTPNNEGCQNGGDCGEQGDGGNRQGGRP